MIKYQNSYLAMWSLGCDLPLIWSLLISLSFLIYAALDGFDLGIGIVMPFAKTEKDKDIMISSIIPFWDGNETWICLLYTSDAADD